MAKRSLTGKVVVITGGGRGIGAATARALVREGAKVAIGDIDVDTAEATAKELGEGTYAAHLDVTNAGGFATFLDDVEREVGPIYSLINNAGIMPLALFHEEDDAIADRMIDINLRGVIYGSREALRRMLPRGEGHLVNVSSTAGKAGFPGGATYCATKFGVFGLSEAIRGETKGSGIEVTVVMPAIVRTELAAGLGEARGIHSVTPEDVAEEIVGALQKPRFDVFVPRKLGRIAAVVQPLPRRVREGVAHALKGDTILLNSVHSPERDAYQKRAANS